jgi:hypothetical protein
MGEYTDASSRRQLLSIQRADEAEKRLDDNHSALHQRAERSDVTHGTE